MTLTAAWLPFFDGGEHRSVYARASDDSKLNMLHLFGAVNMVLFIAPVSAFNQTLTEDRRVNRLVRPVSLSEHRS
jgi:hypothetical protein